MRLFVAVELPPDVLQSAASVSRELRVRAAELSPAARLTWIPPDRMHLTIRFLGEIDSARAASIVDALSLPFQTAAFSLAIGRPGAFPPRGAPRVLWLGLAGGATELHALEHEVSARLELAGFARETRAFSPHLTLARIREPHGLSARTLLDGITVPEGTGGVIDAFTLFESRLSPRGPLYTAIRRTPLRAA
jgi:2'-5' RNA ligase